MEHQLRLRDSTRSVSQLLVENTTFAQRDESVNQKVVGSGLDILLDDFAPGFVDHVVNCAVSLRTGLHLAKVHTLNDSWIWIQKCFFAKTLDGAHYLPCERPRVLQNFEHHFFQLLFASIFSLQITNFDLGLPPDFLQLLLVQCNIFNDEDSSLHRLIHQWAVDCGQIEPWNHCAVQQFLSHLMLLHYGTNFLCVEWKLLVNFILVLYGI